MRYLISMADDELLGDSDEEGPMGVLLRDDAETSEMSTSVMDKPKRYDRRQTFILVASQKL